MGSCQVFQIKHQCPLKRDNNLWLILSIQFHLLLHGMVLAIEMCVCVCVCVCVCGSATLMYFCSCHSSDLGINDNYHTVGLL